MSKKNKANKEKQTGTNQQMKSIIWSDTGFWGWAWTLGIVWVSLCFTQSSQIPTYDLRWVSLEVGTILLGWILVFQSWITRRSLNHIHPVIIGVAIYGILYTVAFLYPANRIFLLIHWIEWFSLIALMVIGYLTIPEGIHCRKIIHGVLIAGTIASIYAFLQKARLDPIHWDVMGNTGNISSFLGNSNLLGWYLAVLLPLALALFFSYPEKSAGRKLSCIYFVVIGLALVLSKNRAGLIAAVLALGFMLVLMVKKRERIKHNAGSETRWASLLEKLYQSWRILVSLSGILILLLLVIGSRYYMQRSDVAIKERLLHWKSSALMVKDHPFLGIGPGNYLTLYLNYQARVIQDPVNSGFHQIGLETQSMNAAHSHNELIQSLAETGILGFCALCFFLALFFIQGYRSWIRTTELNSERFLFLGCYCNVVTSILCGLFGFPWQVPVTGMLFWVILGMTLKLDTCPNESFWPGSIHSIITNWWNENRILSLSLVSIIWLGYTVWGLPFAINHYRASLDIRQGRYFAEQEGRFDEAITVMEDAVRIDPTNGLANYYLGGYYAHQQRGTEALERYEASLQNYNDSHIFFNIGQIHFGHKEFPKAQEYFVKALFLNPHYYMASRQLGLIYAYNNDWNNALVYLKKYMESNPSGPEGDQIRAIIPEIENQMKIVESHTSGGKK